jgi:hypothetical protein
MSQTLNPLITSPNQDGHLEQLEHYEPPLLHPP